MIHFIPESVETASDLPGPYAEAVARLASIRQALACVEQFAGEAPSDSMAEAKLAAARHGRLRPPPPASKLWPTCMRVARKPMPRRSIA